MPLFDFANTTEPFESVNLFTLNGSTVGGSITTGSVNVTDLGVTFTLSTVSADGTSVLQSDPTGTGNLRINNLPDGGGVFTLTFSGTAGTYVTAGAGTSVALGYRADFSTVAATTTAPLGTLTAFGTFGTVQQTVFTGNADFKFGGAANKIVFTPSNPGQSILTFLNLSGEIACFCAGTRIATPDGFTQVENLRAGDVVRTAQCGTTTVKWLGVQRVDTRLSHPAKVNPICITAGAFGEGLPERDLLLSADHAIAIDGMLINAGALVDGQTIYQVRTMPLDGFTYYHIETDAHELILAEGLAAESFIDYAGADSFVNGGERDGAVIPEMDLPRISAARLVPERIRAFLKDRADAIDMRAA